MTPVNVILKKFDSLSLLSDFVADLMQMEELKTECQEKYGNKTINVDSLNLQLTTKNKKKSN